MVLLKVASALLLLSQSLLPVALAEDSSSCSAGQVESEKSYSLLAEIWTPSATVGCTDTDEGNLQIMVQTTATHAIKQNLRDYQILDDETKICPVYKQETQSRALLLRGLRRKTQQRSQRMFAYVGTFWATICEKNSQQQQQDITSNSTLEEEEQQPSEKLSKMTFDFENEEDVTGWLNGRINEAMSESRTSYLGDYGLDEALSKTVVFDQAAQLQQIGFTFYGQDITPLRLTINEIINVDLNEAFEDDDATGRPYTVIQMSDGAYSVDIDLSSYDPINDSVALQFEYIIQEKHHDDKQLLWGIDDVSLYTTGTKTTTISPIADPSLLSEQQQQHPILVVQLEELMKTHIDVLLQALPPSHCLHGKDPHATVKLTEKEDTVARGHGSGGGLLDQCN